MKFNAGFYCLIKMDSLSNVRARAFDLVRQGWFQREKCVSNFYSTPVIGENIDVKKTASIENLSDNPQ